MMVLEIMRRLLQQSLLAGREIHHQRLAGNGMARMLLEVSVEGGCRQMVSKVFTQILIMAAILVRMWIGIQRIQKAGGEYFQTEGVSRNER